MKNYKRVLITGISGSGGSYLAEHIVDHYPDVKVFGVSRWHSTTANHNLERIKDKVTLFECDLNDYSSTLRALEQAQPDAIFNLAAHANVRACFNTPIAVLQNNIMSTANLFECVHLAKLKPKIVHCSTSEVYGQVDPKRVPIVEDCPINPSSPYAVSKAAQDFLGYTYFMNHKMEVVRTRMFSYLNPRRKDLFATSFAMQVARIELGLQKELKHGNLDSIRTLIDVRDAMDTYWLCLTHGVPGEVYNLGGIKSLSVGDFLEILKSLANCRIPSSVDPNLLRPTDVTLQIPDTTKFEKLTGWAPKYNFKQSLEFLLNYCREEAKRELAASSLAR
jgi:GDPmannose 4,6-dehydratase/GDP-4-dehydro-6-deoxy-D-mannose reductase